MKIFFMCTHPNQGTGYARVANKITNYLADLPGVDVVYYAFQNYPGQAIEDRFIDPRIKFYDALAIDSESPKGFGDKGIVPAIIEEKPDVLFLYNDLPVSVCILDLIPVEHMPSTKYVYLDIVYPWERLAYYESLKSHNIDLIWVFLNCWKKHLVEDLGFDETRIEVLPHGVDFERFTELDPIECRQRVGFDVDDYVVVNMNRNSYRKQWCVTIKAFLHFLKVQDMNPKIKLYCGCQVKTDDGYDIPELVHTECVRNGMDTATVLNNHIFINPRPLHLPESDINDIYNVGDVGMNTCCGEGFGLTTIEHAYFNKPQIVSGVPALIETLGEVAYVVTPALWTTVSSFESHSGDVAHFDYMEFATYLGICFATRHQPFESQSHIKKNYSWEKVYKVLEPHFIK